MIYGLAGASGVGKTTLGEMVADSLQIDFVKTSITELAMKRGYNAIGFLSLRERLELQRGLLEDHLEQISKLNTPVILDRTPLDLIGYMMAEVHMNSAVNLTASEMKAAAAYVSICQYAACEKFDAIFHLAPLPFYETADTRPGENPAYQAHVDLIIRGSLHQLEGQISCMTLGTTDLNERHDAVHDFIMNRLDDLEALRKKNSNIH